MPRIICVGVGGSGMSALAQLFHRCGYQVVGIDSHASIITDFLSKQGITVIIGHGQTRLQSDDFLIYSDATISSPEVMMAKQQAESDYKHFRYPLSYFQCVGEISKYLQTIAIAGTHGKSTTTSMMISILHDHPAFALGIVGAQMKQFGGANFMIAQDKHDHLAQILGHIVSAKSSLSDYSFLKQYYLVIEADEFNRHFLHLDIDHLLITNIQRDHPDTYPTAELYDQVFGQCIDRTRHTVTMLQQEGGHTIAKKYADRIRLCPLRSYDFTSIFGSHNQANASLVEGFVSNVLQSRPEQTTIHYRDDMTVADRQTYKQIRLEMLQQSPEAFGEMSYSVESTYDDDYWISAMQEQGRYRVRAYDSEQVIGAVNAKVWLNDPDAGGLFGLYIRPVYRGSGVAHHLLDKAIDFLCSQDIKHIKLCVSKNNTRATAFYLKYGFKIVGETIIDQHGISEAMYMMTYTPTHLKLCHYLGISRRCEYLGQTSQGVKIYTDYAHHPTEVQASYQALCDNFPDKQIRIIYQPHQAGRVFHLWDEMVQVCSRIDSLILYRIYTAREDIPALIAEQDRDIFSDIHSADDLGHLLAQYTGAQYITGWPDIKSYIDSLDADSIVCIMTAGDLDGQVRSHINNLSTK